MSSYNIRQRISFLTIFLQNIQIRISGTDGIADISDVQSCPLIVSEEIELVELRGLKVYNSALCFVEHGKIFYRPQYWS